MRSARSRVVVGRDEELAAIRSALRRLPRRGACLVVLGEAGAGKTRLLREARAMADELGLPCLTGAASTFGAGAAFGVLAEALRGWTRSHPVPEAVVSPFADGLRQVLPELASPGSPELTSDQLRLLALEGALRLLIHAGGSAGVVLLLDDLQDADPETLTFVRHAASGVAREPALVIGTARVPEGSGVAAEARALEDRGLASVLELGSLTETDVAGLVEAILDAPPPAELLTELSERTGGVPLLVEELVEASLDSGALEVREGRTRWAGRGIAPVPGTVLEVVRRKLAQVPGDGARLLAVAATLGWTDLELLADVTGRSGQELAGHLKRGIEVGLLERGPSTPAFRHALVREAMEQTLLGGERAEVHRRAAASIEKRHGDDPAWLEERARHLEAAGSDREAAVLLLRAGRRSLDGQTPASAEAALRRATALAGDPEVETAARDALAEAAGMQGRWEESLTLDAALLESAGETPERLERMARHAVWAGRLDDADGYLDRARALGARPGRVEALAALALLWRGDLDRATSAAEGALREEPEDAQVVCSALDVLGRARAAQGRAEEAAAAFERWIETAKAAGLTASELQGLMELGVHEFLQGRPDDHLREARELAGRHGVFATLVFADLSLLWWCGRRARVGEAVAFGEEAVDLCRRLSLDLLPHAVMALGWARGLTRGGSGEADVREALELAPDDPDLRILAGWMRGEWQLRSGRYEEAAETLEATTRLMDASPSGVPPPAPFLRVGALVAAGRDEEAERALGAARSSPALSRQYVNRFWLSVGEALVARSPDRLDGALREFAESSALDVAVAEVLAAEVFGGGGAAARLRTALEAFDEAGMETDAARTRRLLRALGAPVPRAKRRGDGLPERWRSAGVTGREAEVLTLVARGYSNRRIAEELYLSPRTVQSHVSSLLAKLQVENRAGLVAAGLADQDQR